MRTLMYEYCRLRYDASLSSEGIRKAGETIDESEWIDPASLPKPELHALPVPPLPKTINLITDAVSPLCFISYVGKANFGAAERYIREMYTEVYSTHAMGAEVSAIGGTFCISFMHLFTTDIYLNAFLDELCQLGIDCQIVSRHPILVAPVADFRAH